MTILDRYLSHRLVVIVFFAVLVFTISWLAPETMFQAIKAVSDGKLTLEQGLAFMLYQVPEVLTYCLPISMLFASLFLFRQLSLSSELTAMLASGISFRRLLVPIGAVGLGVSFLFFITQELFIPQAAVQLRELHRVSGMDGDELDNSQITFVEKDKSGSMRKFLVISPQATTEQSQFIFLFYDGKGNHTRIHRMITANRGHWDDTHNDWILRRCGIPGGCQRDL